MIRQIGMTYSIKQNASCNKLKATLKTSEEVCVQPRPFAVNMALPALI